VKIRWISILLLLALTLGGVFAHGTKCTLSARSKKRTPIRVVVKTKEGKSLK